LVIKIKNLPTCFGSLNHPQANSQNTALVHSVSTHTGLLTVCEQEQMLLNRS